MWQLTSPHALAALDGVAEALPQQARVLDVAAGTGSCVLPLAQQLTALGRTDVQMLATDISPAMLARLASTAEAMGVADRVRTEVMDARALAVADGSQDLVTCVFGVMLMPEQPRVVAEIARVLKPGGRFLMVTWEKAYGTEMMPMVLRQLKPGISEAAVDESKAVIGRIAYNLDGLAKVEQLLKPAASWSRLTVTRHVHQLCLTEAEAEDHVGMFAENPVLRSVLGPGEDTSRITEALRIAIRQPAIRNGTTVAVITDAIKA